MLPVAGTASDRAQWSRRGWFTRPPAKLVIGPHGERSNPTPPIRAALQPQRAGIRWKSGLVGQGFQPPITVPTISRRCAARRYSNRNIPCEVPGSMRREETGMDFEVGVKAMQR